MSRHTPWCDRPWIVRAAATIFGAIIILAILFLIGMGVWAAVAGMSYVQAFDTLLALIRNKTNVNAACIMPLYSILKFA